MASPNVPPGVQLPALVGSLPQRPFSLLADDPPVHRAATALDSDDNNSDDDEYVGTDAEHAEAIIHTRPQPIGYGAIANSRIDSGCASPSQMLTGPPGQKQSTTGSNSSSTVVDYTIPNQGERSPLLERAQAESDISSAEMMRVGRLLKEVGSLARLASPVVLAYLLQKSIDITCVFSLGHLGAEELAASALGTMFNSVTGWSVALGMATALDTLGSQAYTASRDPHAVGVYLQRAVLILMLMAVPIAALWWSAESILVMLGQDPVTSALSGQFIRWSLPSLVPYLIFECVKRYLQAQGIMYAGTYILFITAPLNVLTNYLLVWWPPISLGFIGAPIATSITHWLNLILVILFVRYVRGSECWGGFSRDALCDWGPFLRLGMSGVALVCSEWWAFEVVALAAGYLGTVSLAAQSVLLTTASVTYMIPAGISIAACNRIGNEVGLRHPNRAQLACNSSLVLALVVSTFNTTILLACKDRWGYLFNSDPAVVALVGLIMPIAALFQVGDVGAGVASGILRGIGRQHIGAYLSIVAYYILALPIGLMLTFHFDMGLAGLWWGLCGALFIVAGGEVVAILRIDWRAEVIRCMMRIDNADLYEESCVI